MARGRDEGASAIEFAILAPILILTLLAVFQFAFYYYAREITLAAAQSGARVARTTPGGGWQGEADRTARDSASKVGRGMLDGDVRVASGEDGDHRWVEVSGKVVKVIPFLDFHVSQRSGGPIECFRPDVGSGTACQGGGAP
ncbi:TadE family protein [Spirillospora sp. NPDC049652]